MFISMEYASIIKRLLAITGIPASNVYYDPQQKGFAIPSMFLPSAEINASGHSLGSYRVANTVFIKVFAATDQDAMEYGQKIIHDIMKSRNRVYEVDEDGTLTPRTFKVNDPSSRLIDTGAAQVEISWNPVYDYTQETGEPITEVHIETILKGG